MKFSYEEAKEIWDIAGYRRKLTGRDEYVIHILKKFSLNYRIHRDYLNKYYLQYMKEKKNEQKRNK